ncbi:hypothetical protein GCK72_002736 [Caenorhabditis remanei]|uniref:Uncharacterized protein n=1 Tax=Caenorhabditis remanei TaxID=31234 RepID=A0A6A5HXV9_CAERE|nr:hypothetical protein GCK72_002736 [Caenorhabditis remanei]KAF1770912.1 hypothetical protein GCK72_002736 [Caenorhabditis remanei]
MYSLPTTLLEYYTTNYTKCQQSFSIFSTPEFLSIGAKSQFFVIVPINLFGFYCIICKTPKYMKEFQFHLFHMQFWFLILTIFYTILTTPYHFYPAEVRCSVGFFRDFGISSRYQVYLINLVYGGIVSAVILLFENRHRHLVPSTDIFYNIKGLINICILFIPSHSVFSTTAVIIFNVPYRNFVKKILGIGQDNSISRVAIVSSF